MPIEESRKQVYFMFAIVVLTCAIGSLTQTVMNSMLGAIGAEFGTPDTVSQWLTTVFMLGIGITVPLVTHLSRVMSIRSLTLLALGLFLAGSVIDLFAPSFIVLFFGRILQAIGTGISLPVIQTISMVRFPKGQNGTAMGIGGIAMGFAPNIGPLIGGALVDSLGWRSFFVMLSAVLIVLIVCTLIFMVREDVPAHDSRLDVTSFLLSTFGFGGLLLAFTNAASMPLLDPLVWVSAMVGAICLIWFVVRQGNIANPLIDMAIFRSGNYVVSFVAQNCLFASFMGITLIVPLFVQNVSGLSALDAGIVFLPATVLAVVFNPLSGILSDKIGSRPVLIAGSVFLSAGAILMVFMDETTPLWLITLMQTIRGIGVSSLIGPFISWGMRDLPPKLMVDGSAFFTAARQACASFGTALMMLAISVWGSANVAAMEFGFSAALALSAAFSVCVLILALWKVR